MSRARSVADIHDGSTDITTLGTVTAGTLGSGVTFPSGHVLQVKMHRPTDVSGQTSAFNFPTSAIGFDSAIQSTSDVLVYFFATLYKADTNSESRANVYMNGGGFDSASNGPGVANGTLYRLATQYMRAISAYCALDTAPGSTTPTYSLYFDPFGSLNFGTEFSTFILMEISG